MIRRHSAPGCDSEAVYSSCETWRYALTRRWGEGAPLLWIMLNPSTATELRNDPTIERCERRTRAMGYPAMSIANLYAFRATAPRDLFAAPDPIGPDNDATVRRLAREAGAVVCGWGVHGARGDRGAILAATLDAPLLALGTTKDGHPRHPLYVRYSVAPSPWCPPA